MVKTKSSSTVYPADWDTTSSETTVYHNENVVVHPAYVDESTGMEIPIMYDYDQIQYTKEEYAEIRINQNTADIAYLSMMTNVDLGGV